MIESGKEGGVLDWVLRQGRHVDLTRFCSFRGKGGIRGGFVGLFGERLVDTYRIFFSGWGMEECPRVCRLFFFNT